MNERLRSAAPTRFRFLYLRRILRPANRIALDRWVTRETSALTGFVLNAGCGEDTRRFGRRTVRLDAFAPGVDVRADFAERLPFRNDSFDAVICTEVMEHVPDYRRLLGEVARVLKPSGTVVLSVPFVFQYHPDPIDLIRLTPAGLSAEMVRAGFDVDCSGGLGNRLVAFLLLLEGSNVISKIIVRVIVIVLSPFIANIEARDAWSGWSANAVAVGHKRVNAGR